MTLFGAVIDPIKILKVVGYASLGYFSYLMILITIQYLPIDFDVAFLRIKQKEIQYPYYQLAFFTHVYTSIFTLIIGIFQFSKTIRKWRPTLHRMLGKMYVGIILFLAGPSGLIMGYHANGGIFAKLSFCILSILWIYFTMMAFLFAKRQNWTAHRNYVIRSYALTLSAISLRLFKWMIVSTFALPPMDTYLIVSWLGWVINLAIAEGIINCKTHSPTCADIEELIHQCKKN